MKVLVTGGAGFIGSALTRELLERGHAVEVVDCLTYAGRVDNLPAEVPLHACDITVRSVLGNVFERVRPDAVAHLAADSHVQRSFGDFQRFIHVNAGGTETVLDACVQHGVRSVLHVSTDEVFGNTALGAYAYEEDRPAPRNPYAASKAAAEMVVRAYRGYRALPVKIARLANCYGPRQHVEKLIPCAIARIVSGMPVEIHGDGLQRRDWLYVEDAARGLADVIERGPACANFHLPAWQEASVAVVVGHVIRALGRGDIVRVPDRPGGNDLRYGMAGQRAFDLGWRPTTHLRDGIEQTVAWYLEHQDRLALELVEACA